MFLIIKFADRNYFLKGYLQTHCLYSRGKEHIIKDLNNLDNRYNRNGTKFSSTEEEVMDLDTDSKRFCYTN